MHSKALYSREVVDVVIVNWNGGEILQNCIGSIFASHLQSVELGNVVVVDNASTDESVAEVSQGWGGRVTIISNAENRGFGAACNQGAACCRGRWLLFLNPDARLNVDSIEGAVSELRARIPDKVRVVGIALEDSTGKVARSCARLPSWRSFCISAFGLDRIAPRVFKSFVMNEWAHDEARDVDHVIGAFYMMERDAFVEVGCFDERFFLYLEDVDLSQRILQRGYKIRFVPEVTAFHQGGGTSRRIMARRLFLAQRSRMQYSLKHFSTLQAIAVILATAVVEPVIRLAWALGRLEWNEVLNVSKAYLYLWRDLGGMLLRSAGGARGV